MITLCFCMWCLFSWSYPLLRKPWPWLMVIMVSDADNLHNLIFKTICLSFLVAQSLLNGSSLGLSGSCSFPVPAWMAILGKQEAWGSSLSLWWGRTGWQLWSVEKRGTTHSIPDMVSSPVESFRDWVGKPRLCGLWRLSQEKSCEGGPSHGGHWHGVGKTVKGQWSF